MSNEIEKIDPNDVIIETDNENIYKLKNPFTWAGKTYTEFHLDFEKLTGRDLINAERDFTRDGGVSVVPKINIEYQAYIAARASGVSNDVIINLPAVEFSNITSRVMTFLMMQG